MAKLVSRISFWFLNNITNANKMLNKSTSINMHTYEITFDLLDHELSSDLTRNKKAYNDLNRFYRIRHDRIAFLKIQDDLDTTTNVYNNVIRHLDIFKDILFKEIFRDLETKKRAPSGLIYITHRRVITFVICRKNNNLNYAKHNLSYRKIYLENRLDNHIHGSPLQLTEPYSNHIIHYKLKIEIIDTNIRIHYVTEMIITRHQNVATRQKFTSEMAQGKENFPEFTEEELKEFGALTDINEATSFPPEIVKKICQTVNVAVSIKRKRKDEDSETEHKKMNLNQEHSNKQLNHVPRKTINVNRLYLASIDPKFEDKVSDKIQENFKNQIRSNSFYHSIACIERAIYDDENTKYTHLETVSVISWKQFNDAKKIITINVDSVKFNHQPIKDNTLKEYIGQIIIPLRNIDTNDIKTILENDKLMNQTIEKWYQTKFYKYLQYAILENEDSKVLYITFHYTFQQWSKIFDKDKWVKTKNILRITPKIHFSGIIIRGYIENTHIEAISTGGYDIRKSFEQYKKPLTVYIIDPNHIRINQYLKVQKKTIKSWKLKNNNKMYLSFLLGNHGAHMLNGNTDNMQIDTPLTTQESFKIHYLNIRGMNINKLEIINKYMDNNPKTILCVAETWFIKHEEVQKNKYFFSSSLKPILKEKGRRHGGGLSIFVSKDLKNHIKISNQQPNYIETSILGSKLIFVYFKPSMGSVEIKSELDRIHYKKPDLLIGDFNINFKLLNSNIHKQNAVLDYCNPRQLNLCEYNSNDNNKWDFCFTTNNIKYQSITYTRKSNFVKTIKKNTTETEIDQIEINEEYTNTNDKAIKTDHGIITLKNVRFKTTTDKEELNDTTYESYNIWKLQNPTIRIKFIKEYEKNTDNIQGIKNRLENAQTPSTRQQIIDEFNNFINNAIHRTCYNILGKSRYRNKKNPKRNLLKRLQNSNSVSNTNHIIKLWKNDRNPIELKGTIDEAKSYYQNLYKINQDNDIMDIDEKEINNKRDPETNIHTNNIITSQPTAYKIYSLIKKYDSSKAAGPEKIPVIILNRLKESKTFLIHLSDLFYYCLKYEMSPLQWNESLISIIPKNNKNDFTINNSRGIALTAVFRRIYEKIVLEITQLESIKDGFKLHPNQQGFIKKTGTIPNAIMVHDSLKFGRKIKIFIDLKAAYDRTNINLILKYMEQRQIPTKIINVIKNLFSNCSSRVLFNNETSDTFQRETGIFQGSILAPLLFNIFIDSLATDLQKESDFIHQDNKQILQEQSEHNPSNEIRNKVKNREYEKCINADCTHTLKHHANLPNDHFMCPIPHCHYVARIKGCITAHIKKNHNSNQVNKEYYKLMPHFLFFADDIIINSTNENEAQRLLNIIGNWCQANGMSPGFNKCNYISDEDHELKLLNENLARTETYKYLGLPIKHEGIDFRTYLQNKHTKTRIEFEKIKVSGNYHKSYQHKITVLKSHVLSHLEYAMAVIGLLTEKERKELTNEIKNIDILINQSRRWACNIPLNVILNSWMTNIWSYSDLLNYRQAALQEQISNLPETNPIRSLIENTNIIPDNIKKELLSLRTTKSTIYKKFIDERNTNNQKLTLGRYINHTKKQSVSIKHTVCYTFPSKKNHKSNSDIIFSCKDPKIQKNAICWRQRIVYTQSKAIHVDKHHKYKCKHCAKEFSIGHVKECKLITEGKNKNPKLWQAFVNESNQFEKDYPEAKNYTFLDFLLNNRHFKLFQKLYLMVNHNLLQKRYPQPSEDKSSPRAEDSQELRME